MDPSYLISFFRGEASSLASAERKNKMRKLSTMQQCGRKKIGRKCDIIIRSSEVPHSTIKEYGAGKVGALLDVHGNKILRESGLKLPKVLRDMLNDLYAMGDHNPEKLRQLETIGYIHFGMSYMHHGNHAEIACIRSILLLDPS